MAGGAGGAPGGGAGAGAGGGGEGRPPQRPRPRSGPGGALARGVSGLMDDLARRLALEEVRALRQPASDPSPRSDPAAGASRIPSRSPSAAGLCLVPLHP